MPAVKKDDTAPAVTRVVVPFAYATRTDGEVRMLVKGDVVGSGFAPDSVDHLRSIGFVADDE